MKLYSVLIYSLYNKNPILLYSQYDLTDFSYFYRNNIKELLIGLSKQLIKRLDSNKHYKVNETINDIDFVCHTFININNLCYIMITDKEYLDRLIMNYISDISYNLHLYNNDTKISSDVLDNLWSKYLNPKDSIQKIKDDLDETHIVVISSINKLLERGEKLEDLLMKTENLSQSSKFFLNRTKRLNRCCNII